MLMKLNMHPKWQVTHAHCIINQAGPSGDSSFLATFSFTVCRPWTNQLATDDADVGIRACVQHQRRPHRQRKWHGCCVVVYVYTP